MIFVIDILISSVSQFESAVILELVQKTGYNKESSFVGHFGTNIYYMRKYLYKEGGQLCRICYC